MTQPGDVAAIIDDLVTTDIGGRGTIYPIADANRRQSDGHAPMRAAEKLLEGVTPGENVLIVTGFLIPPTMVQETDGPLGAVSVARAIDIGLDANPIIVCDPKARDVCTATATAGGLSVLDRKTASRSDRAVSIETFPTDRYRAKPYVEKLLEVVDPAAVVAVEKVAPNEAGTYHNMDGHDVSEHTAKVDVLYDALDEEVLTIGIGDAGNEVGMGTVADTVRAEISYGTSCQCPCQGGIASAIETDILVPAAVSNWGGHAIVASLSALINRQILHEPETERQMLLAASAAGGIDGIVGGADGWCDGMAPSIHESIVRLLTEVLPSPSTEN